MNPNDVLELPLGLMEEMAAVLKDEERARRRAARKR